MERDKLQVDTRQPTCGKGVLQRLSLSLGVNRLPAMNIYVVRCGPLWSVEENKSNSKLESNTRLSYRRPTEALKTC